METGVPHSNSRQFQGAGLALVLDDNPLISLGISKQLQKYGFDQVVTFESCATAIAFLNEMKPRLPDIAILDVQLERRETSLPVAQLLVSDNVPFFFLSGHGDGHVLSVQMPAIATLQKPAFENELFAVVNRTLGR